MMNLEKILIEKDINPTAMRLLVLDYFLKQDSAVSLFDLEKDFDHSDRTTLFRTLKVFERKGLLHSIKAGNNATSYALCTDDCSENHHLDSHLHFYCTSCKKTFCLPKTKIPKIQLPNYFRLKELNITAHGLCDKCSR
ncbi:MAG: transcriptional repressor [Flavobacteriaceae bacterium]|jgi:Fur family ferric uptake transcriptional regulator|nr:transcriptional repressor [Flavobacteriaceae bacterium]